LYLGRQCYLTNRDRMCGKNIVPNTTFIKDPVPPGSTSALKDDNCTVKSDVVLISVHENYYGLLLRIKTPHTGA
jgi:hypothetical protein